MNNRSFQGSDEDRPFQDTISGASSTQAKAFVVGAVVSCSKVANGSEGTFQMKAP
jgi:hypothetical protein